MFDFIRYAASRGIYTTTSGKHVSAGWIGTRCVFCASRGDDDHLGFNTRGDYFSCWKCGGHAVIDFIMRVDHCDLREAFRTEAEYQTHGYVAQRIRESLNAGTKVEIPDAPLSKAERRYLRSRGFDPDELQSRYSLRSGGIVRPWAYRIVIPVFEDRTLVTAIGRAICDETEPRYWNMPIEKSIRQAKHCLYNIDSYEGESAVLVVEGVTSVWHLGEGVATFGAKVSALQTARLARFSRITIAFDADEAGRRGADALGTALAALGREVSVVDLPEGCGPTEVGKHLFAGWR